MSATNTHTVDASANSNQHVTDLPAENVLADYQTERVSLPLDIWFLIAECYLLDSRAIITALSYTNRQLNVLLRPFRFQKVFIRLQPSKPTTLPHQPSVSPARRFRRILQSEPGIIRHIQSLRIGNEEGIDLRAINDKFGDNSERQSLCYILSCQYPNLKHLAISCRYAFVPSTNPSTIVPTLPRAVLSSILSAISLPSLCEISILMGSMPWEVYAGVLKSQIDTLNLGYRVIYKEGSASEDQPRLRGQVLPNLSTLRINAFARASSIGPMLPQLLRDIGASDSARLTTLVIKYSANHPFFDFRGLSFPSVTDLRLYYFSLADDSPGANLLKVSAFGSLRKLTLGFNLPMERPSVIRVGFLRFEWAVDILRLVNPQQPLESIQFYIDALSTSGPEILKVQLLPWTDLPNLFLPGSRQEWPTLRQIHVGLMPEDHTLAPQSPTWKVIENKLKLDLAHLAESGILHLHVPVCSESTFFDDVWSTRRLRTF